MAAIFRRHPRKAIAGGVLITAVTFAEYLPNPFRTPGVKQMENRWSSAGGSVNHTPAVATKLGHSEHVTGNIEGSQAIGTPKFEDRIGDQRPEVGDESSTKFDKKWNETHYHTQKKK